MIDLRMRTAKQKIDNAAHSVNKKNLKKTDNYYWE